MRVERIRRAFVAALVVVACSAGAAVAGSFAPAQGSNGGVSTSTALQVSSLGAGLPGGSAGKITATVSVESPIATFGTSCVAGLSKLSTVFSTFASFSNSSSPAYAVIQDTTGETIVGSGTGYPLHFRIANADKFVIGSDGTPQFAGTNTTGSGTALLGTNCPAVTVSAPYTWIRVVTSDGSTAYMPCWK